MALFLHEGQSIEYAPSSDIAAGDVVVQGDLVGIARTPIAANQVGSLAVCGVFEFSVADVAGFAVGITVYWNATNKALATTSNSGANKLLGKVVAISSGRVRVRLTQ